MNNAVQFKLVIPADVKEWLAMQAVKNIRSQGGEIVAILRQHMAQEAEA
ncbi:Arc family DNA-binding protein [Paenirhodobacter populi]|uniref:Arc family DNA-binding protein n=1 Tax=Paenirhodobacter populi TaxID=2306993 RepID=A0A443JDE5_9RHOB|nr:Arc family DNA-binding protein [Sinirhodobacter populi]RWR18512.1 Arc family DNA-binding protein [Sinirhodobacter populi]